MSRRMRVGVLAAFATLGAVAIGAVYAITVEVPVRGTFVSSKEKTELLSGIAGCTANRPTPPFSGS